jgi:cytidylate kinase
VRSNVIIALDGPAGSGKSTVARGVAESLGLRYLDTGAMYRAVALRGIEEGLDPEDADGLTAIAESMRIDFEHEGSSAVPTKVIVDGRDVTAAIRTPEVDATVSAASAVPAVRVAMVDLQRTFGERDGLVAEGRDIGTVVFPGADLKVYLTASPQERARRRHAELVERGTELSQGTVLERLRARDDADSSREASPLAAADDSVEVDTTDMTIEEVIDRIVTLAEERA